VKKEKLQEIKHIATWAKLADFIDFVDKATEIPEDWHLELEVQNELQEKRRGGRAAEGGNREGTDRRYIFSAKNSSSHPMIANPPIPSPFCC
jgi:hypothetical protein